jgi:thiosulfate/3-mercaptopyruvate sulfurtransferase
MATPVLSPLVTAAELGARLGGGSLRLFDARPGPGAYAAGHLPGALHADLDRDLSGATRPGHDPARGGRHPLPAPAAFAEKLGAWGVGPEDDVIVYDAAGGANAAARLWWMLRALGHARAQVLDGGLAAALAAGLALETGPPMAVVRPAYPGDAWTLPTVTADTVEARRAAAGFTLLDVRSRERFRGDAEPFDPVAGHIPGARNLPFAGNLGPDGRFAPAAALRARYEALLAGAEPATLTVHCGSGVTACHTLLALEIAGLPGAALYVGSWSEWCRSGRPQATGEE